MAVSDKDAVKLGFWLAVGFFAFSLIMTIGQYFIMKARKGNA